VQGLQAQHRLAGHVEAGQVGGGRALGRGQRGRHRGQGAGHHRHLDGRQRRQGQHLGDRRAAVDADPAGLVAVGVEIGRRLGAEDQAGGGLGDDDGLQAAGAGCQSSRPARAGRRPAG
jgi:hypothetical protein